ncbi:hypothetical protein C8R44DRAFT_754769 [Mycena epipterygia]|nr:hypothetical protein C8R44DRAFT_754769 [Mycena epipterygia]
MSHVLALQDMDASDQVWDRKAIRRYPLYGHPCVAAERDVLWVRREMTVSDRENTKQNGKRGRIVRPSGSRAAPTAFREPSADPAAADRQRSTPVSPDRQGLPTSRRQRSADTLSTSLDVTSAQPAYLCLQDRHSSAVYCHSASGLDHSDSDPEIPINLGTILTYLVSQMF